MIEYRNKHFFTLDEFVEMGGEIPEVFADWWVNGDVTFGMMFIDRYGRRYLQYPHELGIERIQGILDDEAARVYEHFDSLISAKDSMLRDAVAAKQTETIERKNPPNGGVSFTSGSSDGGTVRNLSNGATVDDLIRIQNEFTDAIDAALATLAPLFMPRMVGGC